MAATRHMQLVIDGLKAYQQLSMQVIILRQSAKDNPINGTHKGIRYQTVMGDALRARLLLAAPQFLLRSRRAVGLAYRDRMWNVLYVYGPPAIDNLLAIRYARKLGFKSIFEIVEDDDLAMDVSNRIWHRISNAFIRHLTCHISELADGIVVVSSHLEAKFKALTSGSVPVHLRPVPVDVSRFPDRPQMLGENPNMFYSGSFGLKDGIPTLLDAFDLLAARYPRLTLTMTGHGSSEDMALAVARIQGSPYSDRIHYKGYLEDDRYHAELMACDIPCMTRINHPYANAGFPFKLGEYLATGKPVIASRVSDVGRWLQDGRSAMLVEPGKPDQIACKIEYLLHHRDIASAIGCEGRRVAKAHFSHTRQAEALFGFIKGILEA